MGNCADGNTLNAFIVFTYDLKLKYSQNAVFKLIYIIQHIKKYLFSEILMSLMGLLSGNNV